jgi:hypothetical protein
MNSKDGDIMYRGKQGLVGEALRKHVTLFTKWFTVTQLVILITGSNLSAI